MATRNKPFSLICWCLLLLVKKQTFLFVLIVPVIIGNQYKLTFLFDLILLFIICNKKQTFLFYLIVAVIIGNKNKPLSFIWLCLLIITTKRSLNLFWFDHVCYYWQHKQTFLFNLIVPAIIANINKPFSVDLILLVSIGNRNKPFFLIWSWLLLLKTKQTFLFIWLWLILLATKTNLSLWFDCACYFWKQKQTFLFDLILCLLLLVT